MSYGGGYSRPFNHNPPGGPRHLTVQMGSGSGEKQHTHSVGHDGLYLEHSQSKYYKPTNVTGTKSAVPHSVASLQMV